ncbi:MAG: DUF1801 domain-containing protein [Proteobacteria bacterium]|nr:DUF1801 domain-containing protein [Pseudomonadota bacterium]
MAKKKTSANKAASAKEPSPSQLIDAKIEKVGGWRGDMLARIREIIHDACPDVVETVKWRKPSNPMGVPVWESAGIICTGESYKSAVKMTFAHGARLKDPAKLFNASLEGGTRRAIDFHEGDKIDAKALKALIREAAAFNKSKSRG